MERVGCSSEARPGEGGGPEGGRESSPTMWPCWAAAPAHPPASRSGASASCGWRAPGCRPQLRPENGWGSGAHSGHLLLSWGWSRSPLSTCASTHMHTQTCSFREYLFSTLPQSLFQVLGIQQRKQNKTKQQSLPSERLYSWHKDGNEKGDTTWSCTVHYLNSFPQATNYTLLSAQNLLQTLQRLKALTNSPALSPSPS